MKHANLKFSGAAWLLFTLLTGAALSQTQTANLTGTVTEVVYKTPQVHFSVRAKADQKSWDCFAGSRDNDTGTPDQMDAAGWNKNKIMETGMNKANVSIDGEGTPEGPITVKTITLTKNKTVMPDSKATGTPVPIVCSVKQ